MRPRVNRVLALQPAVFHHSSAAFPSLAALGNDAIYRALPVSQSGSDQNRFDLSVFSDSASMGVEEREADIDIETLKHRIRIEIERQRYENSSRT
jgi:hypothetical protein